MSRTVYLVSYDIADDRRRDRVLTTMKAFGEHLQFSVFCCSLSDVSRVRLKARLRELINPLEDKVLFADLGPANGRGRRAITTLGVPWEPPARGPVIL